MGTAVAETLVGENKPAGRLNQTWYLDDGDLPGLTVAGGVAPLHAFCLQSIVAHVHSPFLPGRKKASAPQKGTKAVSFRGTTQIAAFFNNAAAFPALTQRIRSLFRRRLRGGSGSNSAGCFQPGHPFSLAVGHCHWPFHSFFLFHV